MDITLLNFQKTPSLTIVDVNVFQNYSFSSFDTRDDVSIPSLCRSSIISVSSFLVLELNNTYSILSSKYLSSWLRIISEDKALECDGIPNFEGLLPMPLSILSRLSKIIGGLGSGFLLVYLFLEATFEHENF